jgi:hypothetical protein
MELIPRLRNHVFTIALLACLAFVGLTVAAMIFYPGGTYLDSTTRGYSFTNNFFSELGMTTANNGQGNLASAGMFFFALAMAWIGLVVFNLVMPRYFREVKIAHLISIAGSVCGVTAGLGFVGVAFTPVNLLGSLHTTFVMNAFRAYMLEAILYTVAIFFHRSYPNRYGVVSLLFAALMIGYVVILTSGPSIQTNQGYVIQVVAQKTIVYASIFNMLIQSWGATKQIELASE